MTGFSFLQSGRTCELFFLFFTKLITKTQLRFFLFQNSPSQERRSGVSDLPQRHCERLYRRHHWIQTKSQERKKAETHQRTRDACDAFGRGQQQNVAIAVCKLWRHRERRKQSTQRTLRRKQFVRYEHRILEQKTD